MLPAVAVVACLVLSLAASWAAARGNGPGDPAASSSPALPSPPDARALPAAVLGPGECLVPGPDAGLPFDAKCLDGQWDRAVRSGQAAAMDRAFLQVQGSRPFLSGFCHDAAYRAALGAVRSGAVDGLSLLAIAQSGEVSCNAGVLHGAMDALALAGAGPEGIAAAVRACSSLTGPSRPDCMGGVGHAAYQSSGREGPAMRDCAELPGPADEAMCVEGVVKQMFRPYGDGVRPADYGPRQAAGVLPRLCAGLSGMPGMSRAGQLQCFKASQEPFSASADAALRDYRARIGSMGSGPAQEVASIARLWQAALSSCARLGDAEGALACRERGGAFVRLHARNDDLADAVCALLEEDVRRACAPRTEQQP